MKERIKNLLAGGMKQVDVASVVGCTPAYVAQLLKDEEFKQEVQELAIANAQQATEEEHIDRRYVNLEHKVLTAIESEIGNAEFPHLLRALETVTKRQSERRREKMPAAQNPSNVQIHVTNIALPLHALQAPTPVVQVNQQNEIIAIDNKPLAPMSADGVKNIFAQMKERKEQDKNQIREIALQKLTNVMTQPVTAEDL